MDMRQVSKKVVIYLVPAWRTAVGHRVMIKTGGREYRKSDEVILTFPFNWYHLRNKINIRVWVKDDKAKIV